MTMTRLMRSAKGFTLVEVLTVLAVLGILLAVAAPSLADMLNRRRVEAIATALSTDLAYARSEVRLRDRIVTIRVQSSCYLVHVKGGGGVCNCLNPPGSECPSGGKHLVLKVNRLSTGNGVSLERESATDSFAFTSPHAALLDPAGFNITVQGNRGYKLETRVSGLGRVLICDPDGSFGGGYKRCPSE